MHERWEQTLDAFAFWNAIGGSKKRQTSTLLPRVLWAHKEIGRHRPHSGGLSGCTYNLQGKSGKREGHPHQHVRVCGTNPIPRECFHMLNSISTDRSIR